MKFSRILTGFALASVLALTAGAASAQNQPGTVPKPSEVQSFGDWTVRCFPIKSVSPCDMYYQINDKNTQQLVLAVSIAYVPSVDRHALQLVVPLGVSLAKGAVIQTSAFTSPVLSYHRCDRAGCYVEMVIANDSVDAFTHAAPNAKVRIVADNGRAFDLPLSLKGFTEAHNAMTTSAKQKADKGPAPGAQPAAPAAQ